MKKILGLFFLTILLASCAKNREAEGVMDDPMTHFIAGKKYWDKGDYVTAEKEFNLAKSLDNKFALAYAGLAMVEAVKGNFELAEDHADDAVGYDDENPQCFIARGIVYQYRDITERDEEWWEDAEAEFAKAAEIDATIGEPSYRLGVLYKYAYLFKKSEAEFRRVLELKKGYEAEADKEWELVQKIVRAAPGTRVGKKVALIDSLTRADAAALFIDEFELDRILDKSGVKNYNTSFAAPGSEVNNPENAPISDMEGHWAESFVNELKKYRIRGLSVGPDGKFYPTEAVSRAHFAMFVEGILMVIRKEPGMATKYIGDAQSRFKDVPVGTPYYNAICNNVDMGIMKSNLQSEFEPGKIVTGADALLLIRNLKELRR